MSNGREVETWTGPSSQEGGGSRRFAAFGDRGDDNGGGGGGSVGCCRSIGGEADEEVVGEPSFPLNLAFLSRKRSKFFKLTVFGGGPRFGS